MVKGKDIYFASKKTKLRTIVNDLIKLENLLKDLSPIITDLEFDMLELLHTELSVAINNYIDIYVELDESEIDVSEFPTVDDFQTNCRLAIAKTNGILKKHNNSNCSKSVAPNYNYIQSLPKLQLPTFTGDFANYKSFIENFHAIIESSGLEPSQKFHYLKNALKEEAALSISGLHATDENYQIALNLLEARYNKPKLIIQSHLKYIFTLASVQKPSPSSLMHLADTLNKHILALKNLNVNDNTLAAALIAYIVEQKLDEKTKEKFKAFKPSEIPSINETIKFLQNRAQLLVDIGVEENKTKRHQRNVVLVSANSDSSSSQCKICKGSHSIYKCPNLLDLSSEQRIRKIDELQLCRNCFGNHHVKNCRSPHKCFKCKRWHHTLLHRSFTETTPTDSTILTATEPNNVDSSPSTSFASENSSSDATITCSTLSPNSQTLLSTAEVHVKDEFGALHTVRCLLDNGSMHNLISSRIVDKLNLPCKAVNMSLLGINSKTTAIHNQTSVRLYSKNSSFSTTLPCLVINNITASIPNHTFSKGMLKIPSAVPLADSRFNESDEIDLLLGAALFYSLIGPDKINLGPGLPVLQETKLGYVVSGEIKIPNNSCISVSNCCTTGSKSDFDLRRFWEIENIQPKSSLSLLSKDEQFCERHFADNAYRTSQGRCTVAIPFNASLVDLGSSHEIAVKRFLALEKRLQRDADVYEQYRSFIKEYEDLGHLTQIFPTTIDFQKFNFLPHHEVFKSSSTTTKLRVVFDGSAKSTSGLSINDCQVMGPQLQRDLFSLLLNFRQHRVAIVGDIEKMYRQILVHPQQRKYQCILWRSNVAEEIKVFQLNTVTYGMKSSSYLATKCLQWVANQNASTFPEATSKIKNDFYMDDFVSGTDSLERAKELITEVSRILSDAGFPLRKLRSNCSNLVESPPNAELVTHFAGNESKTLGIQWNSVSDAFLYSFDDADTESLISKRQILSVIAKVFDPLGLLSPIIIKGKLIVQSLWRLRLAWDDEIPSTLSQECKNFISALSQAPLLSIPRFIVDTKADRIELHGFADASNLAYGACVYVRLMFTNHIESYLLCSKSRVAPLKPTTIPRLELSAAVLLTELVTKVTDILSCKFDKICLWSDSKIVLGWINSAPNKFKIFVANRVAFIREYSEPSNWCYCRSNDNPADLISRGSWFTSMSSIEFWFHGPQSLKTFSNLASDTRNSCDIQLPEIKTTTTTLNCNNTENLLSELISSHSSLSKLQRILAYVLRFVLNLRTPSAQREKGPLRVQELSNSLLTCVTISQQQCFESEIKHLKTENRRFIKNKHLRSLNLFLDEKGLIRVGGRIRNCNLSYDKIHPLLLPKTHPLTILIIRHYHIKYLHCGANQLLALVRNHFWPISGRLLCRQIVYKCIRCFRSNPKFSSNIMGNLPSAKFATYKPCFTETGVDFAGPIMIKDRFTRNPKLLKAYIALFICLTTRAIHLELVTSLSCQAFIDTFKRFVARRGRPRRMHSDNATNFVAAANELKDLHLYLEQSEVQTQLNNFLSSENIEWKFIPPNAPHFGGIWESNIKSVKRHLFKIIHSTNLNFESLYTLLTQIEAVLNSRPLSPLSTDPNDFHVLTPFHFLLGQQYSGLPEPTLQDVPVNRLDCFQRRQVLVHQFWKRWHQEVLPEMQRRVKWQVESESQLQVGTLVLMSEPNAPPFQWPMGRITHLHPGDDGRIRVVSVRMPSGVVLRRPVMKLCRLPLDSESSI